MPAVTVITHAFTEAAHHRGRAIGMPDHPVVSIDHPIASKTPEQARELARDTVHEVIQALLRPESGA